MGKMLDRDGKTNIYTTLLTTYVAMSRNGSGNNITFFLANGKSRAILKDGRRLSHY
jgi:hypothetical protein